MRIEYDKGYNVLWLAHSYTQVLTAIQPITDPTSSINFLWSYYIDLSYLASLTEQSAAIFIYQNKCS